MIKNYNVCDDKICEKVLAFFWLVFNWGSQVKLFLSSCFLAIVVHFLFSRIKKPVNKCNMKSNPAFQFYVHSSRYSCRILQNNVR